MRGRERNTRERMEVGAGPLTVLDGGRHGSVLSHVRNLRNNEVGTGETDGDAQALTSASTPVAIYRTGFRDILRGDFQHIIWSKRVKSSC